MQIMYSCCTPITCLVLLVDFWFQNYWWRQKYVQSDSSRFVLVMYAVYWRIWKLSQWSPDWRRMAALRMLREREWINKIGMGALDRFGRICWPVEWDAAISGNGQAVKERTIKSIILKGKSLFFKRVHVRILPSADAELMHIETGTSSEFIHSMCILLD